MGNIRGTGSVVRIDWQAREPEMRACLAESDRLVGAQKNCALHCALQASGHVRFPRPAAQGAEKLFLIGHSVRKGDSERIRFQRWASHAGVLESCFWVIGGG